MATKFGETTKFPVEIEDEDECIFCAAGHQLIKFENIGDTAFIDVDGHVHKVKLVGISAQGLSIYTCEHSTPEQALKEIAEEKKFIN